MKVCADMSGLTSESRHAEVEQANSQLNCSARVAGSVARNSK
jgi:hypothetical protein